MIKLFRKTRQNLIMENKPIKSDSRTRNYFMYAFGEILLVVIGILIALSINNWNQDRQNKIILGIYTKQLIEEVDQNISKLNTVIDEESKLVIQLDTVIDLLAKKDFENNKMIRKAYALLSFEDFAPETVAFENLKLSGEFKLIQNINLRNAITSAYNTFESVRLTQEVHYYNMKTRIADYFLENANYMNIQETMPSFGKDQVFSNLALAARATLKQKIKSCESSLEKMEELKLLLQEFKSDEL